MKDYIYVPETSWGKLSTQYETKFNTSEDIIKAADLDWTVGALKMYTDLHESILGYHAIYRENDRSVIGVVNNPHPKLIQNSDSFNLINSLLGHQVDVETSGHVDGLRNIFGCFKIHAEYKLYDDDIDQYIVIYNDHLKVDGKVTILYTPVRVICQNTLSYALSNNFYKVRIPVSEDLHINQNLCLSVMNGASNAIKGLQRRSDKYLKVKTDHDFKEKFLDEIFPYVEADDESMHDKANEAVEVARETFESMCLGADNLGNYNNTAYQYFQAITDFGQHYFKNADKAYDLTYRMSLLPGMSSGNQSDIIKKAVKFLEKSAAKAA